MPKSLKTWLALELAVSVASGTDCLGAFPCRQPGHVLVYAAEDSLVDLRVRLQGLCAHRGLPLGSLDLGVITAKCLYLDVEEDVQRLEVTLDQMGPKLLVLDPFVRLHRGINENSSAEVSTILGTLRRLQRQHQTAIALVHHTRKNGGGRPGLALRGSGDFYAWVDVGLYLQPQKTNRVVLTIEHRQAASPEPFAIHIVSEGELAHLELTDHCQLQLDEDDLESRIVDALSRSSVPLSQNRLRRLIKARNQSVTDALRSLEKKGVAEHTRQGWVIPRDDSEEGCSTLPLFQATATAS